MPQLRVLGADGEEQWVDLNAAEYVLGRDPKTDIPLQDKKVSRRHARIFQKGADYFVEDLGSANGVLIGGVPIRKPIPLTNGTEFEIGAFLLSVAAEEEEEEAGMVFSFIGLTTPVEGQTYTLPVADVHLGRGEDCDIVVNSPSVSRNHAVLEVDPDKLVVEDLGSSNGTYVNNERVAREPLKHGDRVRFGNVEFEVVVEEGEAGPGPLAIPGGQMVNRLKTADSSLKLAAAMGVMTVILLVIVIVILVMKNQTEASRVDPFIAYEEAIKIGLASARVQLQNESWEAAIRSYNDVLEQDPIQPEAREGVYRAKVAGQHFGILTAAREDLRIGQPANAIKRLAGIPADSHYAELAASMLREAKKARAEQALTQAQDYCTNKEWERCHQFAIVALMNQRDSATGRELVLAAESHLKKKKIPYTPWDP